MLYLVFPLAKSAVTVILMPHVAWSCVALYHMVSLRVNLRAELGLFEHAYFPIYNMVPGLLAPPCMFHLCVLGQWTSRKAPWPCWPFKLPICALMRFTTASIYERQRGCIALAFTACVLLAVACSHRHAEAVNKGAASSATWHWL